MRTTVVIPKGLLDEIRKIAQKKSTTLRAIMIAALRAYRDSEKPRISGFRMKKSHFKGSGVRPDVDLSDWGQVRGIIYGEPNK